MVTAFEALEKAFEDWSVMPGTTAHTCNPLSELREEKGLRPGGALLKLQTSAGKWNQGRKEWWREDKEGKNDGGKNEGREGWVVLSGTTIT